MKFLGTYSALLLFLMLTLFSQKYQSANITVVNECPFTVWPVLTGVDSNFALNTSKSRAFTAPSSWQTQGARVWGRTNCTTTTTGGSVKNFSCTTGDIEGSPTVPYTFAEFRLNVPSLNMDYYDVTLVDGFNLPLLVAPSRSNCSTIGCTANLNTICPSSQQVKSSDGNVVACRNTCEEFTCVKFKEACPNVYIYPTDDKSSTFSCATPTDYTITFCPSANVSLVTNTPQNPASTPASPPPLFTPQDTPRASPPPQTGAKRRRIRIILIVVAAAVVLILAVVLFVVRKFKQGAREPKLHEWLTMDGQTESRNHNLRQFTYESILSATSNLSFNNKLGEGGFGSVYKGQTSDGQDIAVKVLSQQSGQGLVEFKTELILISKLQHVNLVKLHGFCVHGDNNMIIYDYMPNKSLDFFLFGPSKEVRLNWQQRINIIEGIAQGLLYLHKYSRLKIIHRDLKPSNILLDKNMNAKISDFGLARVFEQSVDEANTNRRVGTFGYMAPEYAMQGLFSIKSDVYSFGVLVLEIVSGRKNNCFHQIEGPLNLVEHAWDLWRNNSALQLMDPTLTSSCNVEQLQRCIHIGLLCVENRAVDRPTSEEVILMLKSEVTSLPRPKNPSFIARNHVIEEATKKHVTSTSSVNEVTYSDIGGR